MVLMDLATIVFLLDHKKDLVEEIKIIETPEVQSKGEISIEARFNGEGKLGRSRL
jgi:hypothetical protein